MADTLRAPAPQQHHSTRVFALPVAGPPTKRSDHSNANLATSTWVSIISSPLALRRLTSASPATILAVQIPSSKRHLKPSTQRQMRPVNVSVASGVKSVDMRK